MLVDRNFFLTQFGDKENLDETGILEMDLSQLTFPTEFKDNEATGQKQPSGLPGETSLYIYKCISVMWLND